MKKKSNKGQVSIGVILGGIALLAGLQFLDAKVFDRLNPFHKDTASAQEIDSK